MYTQRMNPTMSNGNDHPNFPPPPNEPPRAGGSKPESESPEDKDVNPSAADDVSSSLDPTGSESGEATQAMPAPGAGDQAPQYSGPGSQGPDSGNGQPGSGQSQFGQYSNSQNPSGPYPGNQTPAGQPGPYSGAAPQSGPAQGGHDQNGGQQQTGSPYPGAQAYPGAQPQPGSNQSGPNQPGPFTQQGQYQQNPYQTGSGPNAHRTGSGPGQSQAIPQPAPAPGFAGSQAAAPNAQAEPAKKKSKMPLFITLGAVALVIILVLVGFFVVGSVNKSKYGPDKVAEDYVTALNNGDFAGAEKIAPSARPEGTNLDLLAKGFTESSSTKIENAKVESSDVDGDEGTVVVSYELDGSEYNVQLAAKKDGKQDLFFDKWKLSGPDLNVISLDVPAADGMTVNGQDYTAKSGTTSFAVYPGSYDFKIPKSKWVSEASDTAEVNFPKAFAPGSQPNKGQVSPTTLNLDLSPTSDFEKEVQKQVEKELKKCFDNKNIKPKCKFIKYDPTEIPVGGSDKKLDDLAKDGTAKWDMKKMPQVKASFGTDDTSTGSFFTEKPGEFNFSVDGKKAGSSYFSNGNTLSVSGSVKIDGDKLSIEFFDF